MNIPIYVIIFLVAQVVLFVIYFFYKKKKDAKMQSDAYDRLLPLYNNADTVKVALYINIISVNGANYDYTEVYTAKVKSAMTGMNTKVDVALFAPGVYDLVVTSREYSDVPMRIKLEAGQTYQLGADTDGPFFVLDPNPSRYSLKRNL